MKLPIDSSALTQWRQSIGKKGDLQVLAATIAISQACGHSHEKSYCDVMADTTVMKKAMTYPTDRKLLNRPPSDTPLTTNTTKRIF